MGTRIRSLGALADDIDLGLLLADIADYVILQEFLAEAGTATHREPRVATLIRFIAEDEQPDVAARVYAQAAFLDSEQSRVLAREVAWATNHLATWRTLDSIDQARREALAAVTLGQVAEFVDKFLTNRSRALEYHLVFAALTTEDTIGLPAISRANGATAAIHFRTVQEWQHEGGDPGLAALAETSAIIAEFFRDLRTPVLTQERISAIRLLRPDGFWSRYSGDKMAPLAMLQAGFASFVLSGSVAISQSERLWFVQTARELMLRAVLATDDLAPLSTQVVAVCLREAALLREEDPEAIQHAREVVAKMLARAAVIEDLSIRLPSLSALLMAEPVLEILSGEYEGAIARLSFARAMNEEWHARLLREIADFENEMRSEESAGTLDVDERSQLRDFRRTLQWMASAPASNALICDIMMFGAKAEIARRDGDLSAAARYYERAANLQTDLGAKMLEFGKIVISDYGDDTGAVTVQHPQRVMAFHLQAMVSFTRSDEAFLGGSARDAMQRIEDAEECLGLAGQDLEEWLGLLRSNLNKLKDHESPIAINSAIRRVLDLKKDNVGRRTYANAKRNLIQAGAQGSLGRHRDAAAAYQSASLSFDEMSTDTFLQLPEKLGRLAAACREYSVGCMDLELWLFRLDSDDAANHDDFRSAVRRLTRAEEMFTSCGENHWAKCISLFRNEHEALFCRLFDAEGSFGPATLFADKVREARESLQPMPPRGAGSSPLSIGESSQKERPMAGNVAVPPLPLPGITASQTLSQRSGPDEGGIVNVEIEERLVQLRLAQARLAALQRRLVDLKERRDNGRLDDGRYTDLAGSLETEMFGLLQSAKTILRDDPELGQIVAAVSTVDGSEQDRAQLERVAERHNDQALLSQIRKGGKLLLELLIEAGIRVLSSSV